MTVIRTGFSVNFSFKKAVNALVKFLYDSELGLLKSEMKVELNLTVIAMFVLVNEVAESIY